MIVFYDEKHALHAPQAFLARGKIVPSAEQPERAERFLAVVKAGGHTVETPPAIDLADILKVHTQGYLDFLKDIPARWAALPGTAPEVLPNIHPSRHMARKPPDGKDGSVIGLLGWYTTDLATPITAGTYPGSIASAGVAAAAVRRVMEGERVTYALCRPPGHHAYADMAGGFCFLNNVAIAAEIARQKWSKVAILDIDVHHGNGTQGIFYERDDVLFVSIHADPANYYPWYAGFADEIGSGLGAGRNLNIPLPHRTGDGPYMQALDKAFDTIRAHGTECLLISLGLDAHVSDPLAGLSLTDDGFREIAKRTAALGLPTVLVQEGGYLSDDLGGALGAYLTGFAEGMA